MVFQASKKHAGIKGSWGKPIQAATSAPGLLNGGLAELWADRSAIVCCDIDHAARRAHQRADGGGERVHDGLRSRTRAGDGARFGCSDLASCCPCCCCCC